jgi:hypothetical protein
MKARMNKCRGIAKAKAANAAAGKKKWAIMFINKVYLFGVVAPPPADV